VERARRQDRLQRAESTFDSLPFDADTARAYGLIYASVVASGRKARGARAIDLMTAAVARAHGLPLYTRNPADFRALGGLVDVMEI
jgi:predicted nucleic acid-binding protein